MYNKLMPFSVDNNVLTEAQNGFRKNKSTDTESQTFTESMQDALDRECHAIGLFFNLTKPYDMINHDIFFTHSLTHSLMELSPSIEAANCVAT
jgi:hypothetical protein